MVGGRFVRRRVERIRSLPRPTGVGVAWLAVLVLVTLLTFTRDDPALRHGPGVQPGVRSVPSDARPKLPTFGATARLR